MGKINIPQESLQKETFKSLPAKEKEEYIRNLLQKLLQLNPEGVTISQIKEATGHTYSTIWHHLEILNCTAQCYKVSRGNLDIYHPYRKGSHLNDYSGDKSSFSVSIAENEKEKFIFIHEKKESRLGNQIVCNGTAIPFKLMEDLISEFSKIINEFSKTK